MGQKIERSGLFLEFEVADEPLLDGTKPSIDSEKLDLPSIEILDSTETNTVSPSVRSNPPPPKGLERLATIKGVEKILINDTKTPPEIEFAFG